MSPSSARPASRPESRASGRADSRASGRAESRTSSRAESRGAVSGDESDRDPPHVRFAPDSDNEEYGYYSDSGAYRTKRRGRRPLTIVIKLGTSSICDEVTHEPLLSILSLVVETCIKLRREGHRVILVSSGAIGIGLRRLDLDRRPKHLAAVQAIAAVGQCRLIALWDTLFKHLSQPIAQVLLTRNDIADRTQYLNAANTFTELLNMGIIPIVNENDTLAVTEIKFGDNDTLSAITAGMVNADYLFLLTDVDCLYDKNPRTHPDAQPIEVVDDISALEADVSSAGSSVGTGGMATKLTAARLATCAGVTTVITSSNNPSKIFDIVAYIQATKPESGVQTPQLGATGNDVHPQCLAASLRAAHQPNSAEIARQHELICTGADGICGITRTNNFGKPSSIRSAGSSRRPSRSATPVPGMAPPLHTRFTAKPRAIRDRYFWILHGLKPHGTIIIDEGAYTALTRSDKAGLLPAGIVDVRGTFGQQEPVSLSVCKKESDGTYSILLEDVGRALVNYTSVEILRIRGKRSSQIRRLLGYADTEYVAYRDNTAFFDEQQDVDGCEPLKEHVLPTPGVGPVST